MKPVLAAPDLDKEFRVEADASNYATRGVLSMKCSDEKWRPRSLLVIQNETMRYMTRKCWQSLDAWKRGDTS